jgi:hypothetical protein
MDIAMPRAQRLPRRIHARRLTRALLGAAALSLLTGPACAPALAASPGPATTVPTATGIAASTPATAASAAGGVATPTGTTPAAASATAVAPTGSTTTTTTPPAAVTQTSTNAGTATGTTPPTTGSQAVVVHTQAHSTSKLSGTAVAAAVLAALIALGCLVWGVARMLAYEPRWTLSLRHVMAEASFRASATWAEFTDWARLGR